jgi:hypothetical protein
MRAPLSETREKSSARMSGCGSDEICVRSDDVAGTGKLGGPTRNAPCFEEQMKGWLLKSVSLALLSLFRYPT